MGLAGNIIGAVWGTAKLGASAVMNKPYQLGAYIGGGFVASSYLSNLAGQKSNYYGQSGYEARYGGSIEKAASIAPYLGLYAAGLSAFSLGPIGVARRAITTSKVAGSYLGSMISPKGSGAKSFFKSVISAQKGKPKLGPIAISALSWGSTAMAMGYPHEALGGMAGIYGLGGIMAASRMMGAPMTAGFVGGLGVGAYAAQSIRFPAGEGNIQDFRVGNQSTSRNMNFSTAGLVQALHTNRKM